MTQKHTPTLPGFGITDAKGFHITFENGYTVSVQFGYGNYGDNYYVPLDEMRTNRNTKSSKAETAYWGLDGKFIPVNDDTVQGYQTPKDVLDLLMVASGKKETFNTLVAVVQNFVNGASTNAITSNHDETFANLLAMAHHALAKARGEA